ncbi:MAG: aldo/keto reductase [Erysipelotrichaceae bacterium]|nr:aldo/keto reductase [Erysipelotrichaceae bacterium]
MKTVRLNDGTMIPALGQGTWEMGEDPVKHDQELAALRYGIEHGMTLIDTAEMYGEGKSEQLVGEVIRGYDRSKLYLVSKVYPWNAGREHIFTSCEQSLKRLGTNYLDLYLLHWRGDIPLQETVSCMEELVQHGLIHHWGVSNFDVSDMDELMAAGGRNCVTDQVLYHLGSRGVEYDLVPWLKKHGMLTMSYSPLVRTVELRKRIVTHPSVKKVAADHHMTETQVMLAFLIHDPTVFAVPKASTIEHVKMNCAVLDVELGESEYAMLSDAFPVPDHKVELDMF